MMGEPKVYTSVGADIGDEGRMALVANKNRTKREAMDISNVGVFMAVKGILDPY